MHPLCGPDLRWTLRAWTHEGMPREPTPVGQGEGTGRREGQVGPRVHSGRAPPAWGLGGWTPVSTLTALAQGRGVPPGCLTVAFFHY